MDIFNFFISGGNSGLAKEIVRLSSIDNNVFFIARNNYKGYSKIKFSALDMSNINEVEYYNFQLNKNKNLNILINNAATVGEINYFPTLKVKNITKLFNVNYLSPTILTNKFLKQNLFFNNRALVVNIVSGVSKKKLPCLSLYSVSKLALTNNTKFIGLDIKQKNYKNISIIGIDPGMIQTKMQETLRSTEFKFLNIFKDRNDKDEINTAETVASKILKFIRAMNWNNGCNYEYKDL
jgi:short-subunit dehydrogenase